MIPCKPSSGLCSNKFVRTTIESLAHEGVAVLLLGDWFVGGRVVGGGVVGGGVVGGGVVGGGVV